MLTSALRALVKNPVKESFYGKRKKKTINILTAFLISHKSNVKTFLKWIVNNINPKFLFFSASLSNSLPMALSEIAAHTDIKRDSSFSFISLEARKTKSTSKYFN